MEYMCFNQTGDISTLNGSPLKLVDKFTYLGSSVSSTEADINTRPVKVWVATIGGARGVMVIIVGNRDEDTSSNPGQD